MPERRRGRLMGTPNALFYLFWTRAGHNSVPGGQNFRLEFIINTPCARRWRLVTAQGDLHCCVYLMKGREAKSNNAAKEDTKVDKQVPWKKGFRRYTAANTQDIYGLAGHNG